MRGAGASGGEPGSTNALLVACIFAAIDEFNAPAKANLAPFVIGLVVVVIGISFGVDAGYAINPARDLGPRLFAWAQGWGKIAMPGDYANVDTYFWTPKRRKPRSRRTECQWLSTWRRSTRGRPRAA